MISFSGGVWPGVIGKGVEMKKRDYGEISGLKGVLIVIYLVAAFGAYFATFIFSRLARIKDLLGL